MSPSSKYFNEWTTTVIHWATILTRNSAIAVIADRTACSILTPFIGIATSRPLNKEIRSSSWIQLKPLSIFHSPLWPRLLWLRLSPTVGLHCNHPIRWFDTNLLVSARPHIIAVLNLQRKKLMPQFLATSAKEVHIRAFFNTDTIRYDVPIL